MQEIPVVELFQHPWPMVLVPWPSGVLFTVQVAGVLVSYKSIEAICLPLNTGEYLAKRLEELHPGCCVDIRGEIEEVPDSLDPEEAEAIDRIFQETRTPLKVNRDWLKGSTEAWVHVHILPSLNIVLKAFSGKEGILVWANCD